jgi:heptosyltransferase-2
MEKEKIKKILIFGHSNIGDICYDMAVVKPLEQNFPNAEMYFVTSPKGRPIARMIKGIDHVLVFDKHGKHKGLKGYWNFVLEIRKHSFDLIVILRKMQMHYFFGIPRKINLDKDLIKTKGMHVAQKYINILAKQGIKAKGIEFDFDFSKNDLRFAQDVLRENKISHNDLKIGIMPLAAWPLKCWPIDNLNQFIDMLADKLNAKVILLGKTGSSRWDATVQNRLSKKAVSLIDTQTLSGSLSMIKNLDLFIGPDTSLLHLASCMGIPAIGLYGATDPDFIYPLFHKQNIIRSRSGLSCMPCYPGPNGGSCKADGPAACMQAITAEEVYKKAEQLLNRKNNF